MHTVARGPVPRDRSPSAKPARGPSPFSVSIAAWRGPVPRPTVRGCRFYRSAGACPPRSLNESISLMFGMARACPSPYGEVCRSSTVARGPVPRDRSPCAKPARGPSPFSVSIAAWRGPVPRPTVKCARIGMARDRPSPYGPGPF